MFELPKRLITTCLLTHNFSLSNMCRSYQIFVVRKSRFGVSDGSKPLHLALHSEKLKAKTNFLRSSSEIKFFFFGEKKNLSLYLFVYYWLQKTAKDEKNVDWQFTVYGSRVASKIKYFPRLEINIDYILITESPIWYFSKRRWTR